MRNLDRTFPRFAFARRIPARQIITRLLRQVLAGVPGRARPAACSFELINRARLPTPPVGPRPSDAVHKRDRWQFTFLGRTLASDGAIDWSLPSDDRADQLWRMNLHYMEWLSSLSASDGLAAIRQWIAGNPPDATGAGQAPWNAYALSIRVVEWLRFLARPDIVIERAELTEIERSLGEQLGFLVARPETDIGGNHLVRNARAMVWAAGCCSGDAAVALRLAGTRLLRDIVARQILKDGTHFELSPSYHCQVLGDLVDCRAALADEAFSELSDAIERMFSAARVLTHRDGLIAQFGDSGLTMAPTFGELAAALGRDPPKPEPAVLPDGGFAAHGGGPLSLIARFGPIAAEALPAHAHADAGSVEITGPAGRIAVDQGVDVYVAGERRSRSRAAASHNLTIAGDGEMADFFGDFRLGRRPAVRGSATIGPDGLSVETSHDGFRDRWGGLRVTRRIAADGKSIRMRDSLDRTSADPVRTMFLLHPDCESELIAEGVRISGGGLRLRLTGAGSWAIEPAEWWPDMGHERATSRLVCCWPAAHTDNSFTLAGEGPRE
jgi:uncharacterized heparinase superfamily protein